jgi:hypothetical protein
MVKGSIDDGSYSIVDIETEAGFSDGQGGTLRANFWPSAE